jgi:hypothetical protein
MAVSLFDLVCERRRDDPKLKDWAGKTLPSTILRWPKGSTRTGNNYGLPFLAGHLLLRSKC